MAQIVVKPVEDKTSWEDFIATHSEANFLHSWYWGEFHERLGHTVVRSGFYLNDKLCGVLLGIVEPARRGRHLVIPGGPILDWENSELVDAWVSEARSKARTQSCVFVRVRPQLLDSQQSRSLFKRLNFHKSPMHLHAELTAQLDLTKDDEQLKKAMRKGARYEINRAAKLNIEVTATPSPDYLDQFYELQLETARRQGFVPFSKQFLGEQFKVFSEAGSVLMYKAEHEGRLLAFAFIIFYGQEAAYHYGASTELARKLPGAYALQWAAIKEARRRGCIRYNFWGVTGHGQTKHRFYGVSVFKRGFGGDDVAYLPAHDLIIQPFRYALTYAFEKARHRLRRL